MSLVPTKLVINEKGFAKLELGIGKGKKLFDKRQAIKKRDAKIEIARKKKGEINSPNFKKMSSD
jgi:SsrA-binding protein